MAGTCCEHCAISSADHDLLIKIEAHLAQQANDITRLANDGDNVHDDHEKRLRYLEKYGSYALGIIGFIQFGIIIGVTVFAAFLRK